MSLWRWTLGLFLFEAATDVLFFGAEASNQCKGNHTSPPYFEDFDENCPHASYTEVARFLKRRLNGTYDKNVRPNDTGGPVEVLIQFKVMAFGKINEEEMDYTIDIFFRQWWKDDRLAHGHNKVFTMADDLTNNFWTPDTYFRNVKSSKYHRVTRDNMRVMIWPDGRIYFSTRITLTASCHMDLSLFPMDTQNCDLIIESYAYTVEDVVYAWKKKGPPIEVFSADMAQFDLVKIYVWKVASINSKGSFDSLRVNFILRRRTTFFVIQHFIPSAFMALLSTLSFWIDRHAVPARISLCVTCILSTMVLFNSINASLPRISYLKAVDYYLTAGLSLIASCMVEYMFVLNIPNKSDRLVKTDTSGKQAVNLRDIPMTEIMDHKCPTAVVLPEGINGLRKPKRAGNAPGKESELAQPVGTSPDALSGDFLDRVRRPHFIDQYARKVFPLLYVLFNIMYWSYFLPQHSPYQTTASLHQEKPPGHN